MEESDVNRQRRGEHRESGSKMQGQECRDPGPLAFPKSPYCVRR